MLSNGTEYGMYLGPNDISVMDIYLGINDIWG